ncbi:MAG TPA: hypothetical protein VFH38_12410 [Jatrophihabitans sp.]|nr:hypothetical protein [Jatrophihabitans sp.]
MTSWREGTSEAAQQALDKLANVCLELAERQLEQDGTFFPYAIGMESDGEIQLIMADPVEVGKEPDVEGVVRACRNGVAARSADLQAAALVLDVTVPEISSDAVRLELQHAEGTDLTVYMPYTNDGRSVQFGQMQVQPGGDAGLERASA